MEKGNNERKEYEREYQKMAKDMGVEKEANEPQILAARFKGAEIPNFIQEEQRFSRAQIAEISRIWEILCV